MAGIDMEGFHAAPSTRSLLSSLAEVTGVSLTDIIKQGHWSQTSTFQKFYRKNAKECDSNFQSGILNKQLWREEIEAMIEVMTCSFSYKGRAAVLDRLADISRTGI